jgi:hypothetical protein
MQTIPSVDRLRRSSSIGRIVRAALALGITAVLAGGCSSLRSAVGLDKDAPDEFSVVQRAPLSMPPDFGLRAPEPGAPRPNDTSPTDRARQIVIDRDSGGGAPVQAVSGLSPSENALLKRAGASNADPNIRREVNSETATLVANDTSWVDNLMFWKDKKDNAPVVDAEKEAQRIRENAALNQPVTNGETPTIRKKRTALIEF